MADKRSSQFSSHSAMVKELQQRTEGGSSMTKTRTSVSSVSYSTTSSQGQNLAQVYSALEEYASVQSATSETSTSVTSSNMDLDISSDFGVLLDNSAALHKLSVRPRKRGSDSRARSPKPGDEAEPTSGDSEKKRSKPAEETPAADGAKRQSTYQRTRSGRLTVIDPHAKREAVIRELVETEEEFVTDMDHVVSKYYQRMDHASTPRLVSDQRDALFGPFKQIFEFHKGVLLEGLKYYANEPKKLGRTFLRLERDFDKHAQYYEAEQNAQVLLQEDKRLREFFEEYSHKIGDNKRLSEYLKLPIQRINDFQVLIQDLITHSRELREDTADLQRAHELMLGLPQRKSDENFIRNLSGFKGNIHKLGRLLQHEWFTVTDSRGRSRERYLFLFKARILVTKVHRVSSDRNVFFLKDIIKLPDVEVKEKDGDPPNFDLIHNDPRFVRYPLNLKCNNQSTYTSWLAEIRKYAADTVALQEHAEDDLQVDGLSDTDTDDVDTLDDPAPPKDSAQIAKKIKGILSQRGLQTPAPAVPVSPSEPSQLPKVEPAPTPAPAPVPSESVASPSVPKDRIRSDSVDSTAKAAVNVEKPAESVPLVQQETARSTSQASISDYQTIASHRRESDVSEAASTIYASMAEPMPQDADLGNRPRFSRTIRGAFCEPGDKASFDCVVEADPPAVVTWLKDNRPLDDKLADRIRISEQGKIHKLDMLNCRLEDTGLYTARAVNSDGSTTCSAHLIVQTLTPEERDKMAQTNSPVFLVKLHDTEVIEGASVRFMIKVKGEPVPDAEFRKDGKKIVDTDRIKIVKDQATTGFYELVINGVVPEDAGKYSCTSGNRFGEAKCEGEVTVTNEKAIFRLLDSQRLLQPGETPDFHWYKDGAPYDPEERFKVMFRDEEDSLALVFQHVKPEDAGLYTCVAATSSGKISCSAELTVQGAINQLLREPEPPTVLMDLTDTEVSCGGSAMLELKVKGYPKPAIVWSRDGQVVSAGGRFRFLYEDEESIALIIKNVNMEDAGLYTVKAKNDLGEVQTEGRLYIKAPPKFKKKMADMACMTDAPFKMQVEVEGSPAPELKWYKDGQMIIESERIKVVKESENSFSLVIERVVIEDSGSYSVVAANSLGQMSEFWQLVANSLPSFAQSLVKSSEKTEGESVTFQVKADGSPKPTASWRKDGKELKSDGKNIIIKEENGLHTLTVNGLKREDAGNYSCLLSNAFGSKEDVAVLRVRAPPLVKQGLTDTEVKEGQTDVTFTVTVDSYPEPKITWFLDEVAITEERKEFSRTEEKGTYSLIIKEVSSELSGKYTVKIANDLGTVQSSAILSVMYKPKIETALTNVQADEGKSSTLSFKCCGLPEPAVKWFKDGNEVSADARIKIVKESVETYSLVFDLCQAEDQGVYEARLSNEMGETSTSCNLTVDYKPRITSDNFISREIFEEEEFSYEVTAVSQPPPHATWLRNEETLESSEAIEITESEGKFTLRMKKATLNDSGDYTVKVGNRLGHDTKTVPVNIRSLAELKIPKILTAMNDAVVKKGNQFEFKVKIRGDPTPDVQWFKDGESLANNPKYIISHDEVENTFHLVIPAVKEEYAGNYTVKATNELGSDEASASLTVILKPELTCVQDIIVQYSEDTTIEIIVNANPSPDVKWLKDGIEVTLTEKVTITTEEGSSIHTLSISHCELEDAGTYSLLATNTEGETQADVKLVVHTEAPTFGETPKDTTVKTGKTAKITGNAKGVPMPTVTWTKNGEPLEAGGRVKIDSKKSGNFTLSISKVQEADFAQYTCTASNVVGQVSVPVELSLTQEPPVIGQSLSPTTFLSEGEPIKLVAQISGSPLPEFKWFKDNEEVIPDDRVIVEVLTDGTVSLDILEALPEDSGNYKLVAVNPTGTVTTQSAVDVKRIPKKPDFKQALPEEVKITQGKPLRLKAKIVAHPPPEIRWLKDGRPLRPGHVSLSSLPDGTVVLEIENVKPEDAGKYSLLISNELGDASADVSVDVVPPPSGPHFTAPLGAGKVPEGFPVRLDAKVSGYPHPKISWLKNGEPLEVDGVRILSPVTPGSEGLVRLTIKETTLDDAGEYTAIATNSEGESQSSAKLNVRTRFIDGQPTSAPTFLTPPRDVSADEGSPIKLTGIVSGNPIPDIIITRNDEHVDPDRAFLSFDGDKFALEIDKAEKKDEGEYKIYLKNELGERAAEARVTVRKIYQAPCFTQKFTDVQQLPTYDAKFLCKVSGVPKPTVAWSFNNKEIKESEKYRIKRDGDICVLFIRDCTYDDSGRYACIASNPEGEARCFGELEVVDKIERKEKEEAPYFLKKIGDCEVYEGMTAKFTACASGYPEPEFEWYKNGLRIFPTDRIKMEREGSGLLRLTIRLVDEPDVGLYRLRVFNAHGDADCEAELCYDTLESRPKRTLGEQYVDFDKFRQAGGPLPLADRPIINLITDRHLTLSWKPSIPIGPRLPVTYQVEFCECPDGDWQPVRSGIRGCCCDIRNLDPYRDYRFRVRVENRYGVSDPSPYAQTWRDKLYLEPVTRRSCLDPGAKFDPETSPYFPKDFDIDRIPHEGYTHAPRFLRQEQESQYGIKNQGVTLFWYVYGYPKPSVRFYFNDEPIEMGGRYGYSYTRNGQLSLFVNKMLDRDAGFYEAVAENEHGIARQRVRLEVAEHPRFIERPPESIFLQRRPGRLECRISGYPELEIKWYKDWLPLAPSNRIRIQHIQPDVYFLLINDVIVKDEGLYSIVARNPAGAISSSAMVHVEEVEEEYMYRNYSRGRNIKVNSRHNFDDLYDLGDELGRGTQGVTYHAIARESGHHFAAKMMTGTGDLKERMRNEMEIMNWLNHRRLIRLMDAYETHKSMTLVTELASGGELLSSLTRQHAITEGEVAGYIRQVLQGLEFMHNHGVAHLGLTPGDILLARPDSEEIKISDFGLARRIHGAKLSAMDYGMPEFVAPETANGEPVGLAADMWSVGVITYLLLSGISPFRGETDRDTLQRVQDGQINFDLEAFSNISDDAKDFIAKLLVFASYGRLNVQQALEHPWLTKADRRDEDAHQIPTDRLKNYYGHFRDWYSNASCRNWYRRRPLSGAFTHPSCMVYPPGEDYTPRESPEPPSKHKTPMPEIEIPFGPPRYPEGVVTTESHYQYGPDTYLLQHRDVDFPVRLRQYMKVASERSPSFALRMHECTYEQRMPVVYERRRFTDVMDEEIDDERRSRYSRYGSGEGVQFFGRPRRLKTELGTRPDALSEAEAIMEYKRDGMVPFMREKPRAVTILDNQSQNQTAQFTCLAVGEPEPVIQWFKNDVLLVPGVRISITEETTEGKQCRSTLKFDPVLEFDAGVYKVVARNRSGQTVARTRLLLGELPSAPDSPEVTDISDTEVLLRWKVPRQDGNSPVLCYSLQQKLAEGTEWSEVADNIDHEFFLVHNLTPSTEYQFRIAARNKFGWGDRSIPTKAILTKATGTAPVITVNRAMKYLQQITESGRVIEAEDSGPALNYAAETEPVSIKSTPATDDYTFIAEMSRGRFSVVAKCADKINSQLFASKMVPKNQESEDELAVMRTLCHERVVQLQQAYDVGEFLVFILEKMQGCDVLTYFAQRHEYNEQMVASVVGQVLDGLQYLHWRGFAHLDLQPDNILLKSIRSTEVKICDMGSAQKISKLGTNVPVRSFLPYTAPELLNQDPAYPQSDVWSLGVVAYVLLSGVSPFSGETDDETRQNITYVRYRFEPLYKEISMEATRFLMLVFKRAPSKRPSTEECLEHRWLQPSEFMLKKRERAVFLGNRLKEYSDAYHEQRRLKSKTSDSMLSSFGLGLGRSISSQPEILATF